MHILVPKRAKNRYFGGYKRKKNNHFSLFTWFDNYKIFTVDFTVDFQHHVHK